MSTSIAAGPAKWGPLAWPLYPVQIARCLGAWFTGSQGHPWRYMRLRWRCKRFHVSALCFVIRARKTREGQRQRVRHYKDEGDQCRHALLRSRQMRLPRTSHHHCSKATTNHRQLMSCSSHISRLHRHSPRCRTTSRRLRSNHTSRRHKWSHISRHHHTRPRTSRRHQCKQDCGSTTTAYHTCRPSHTFAT